jgi:hypothetical protein
MGILGEPAHSGTEFVRADRPAPAAVRPKRQQLPGCQEDKSRKPQQLGFNGAFQFDEFIPIHFKHN